MQTYAVYFRPVSRLGTWPLTSDMLSGAVCWGMRLLGLMSNTELTAWLERQVKLPRFAFSHAFPAFFGRTKTIRYYPRPASFQPTIDDFERAAEKIARSKQFSAKEARFHLAGQVKRLKKIRYVTEASLQRILTGESTVEEMILEAQKPGSLRFRCEAYCSPGEENILPEIEKLVEIQSVQHNQVDRVSGATVENALFFKNEVSFSPGTGLWALLRCHEEDFHHYLLPALRYISDSGLGADRTTGRGFFQITTETFAAPEAPVQVHSAMCLSHYSPAPEELDFSGKPTSYTLVTLRPKREHRHLSSYTFTPRSLPVFKQSVHMFAPGSVLPLKIQKEIYGHWVRVTPTEDEPVFQCGAAIMLPL